MPETPPADHAAAVTQEVADVRWGASDAPLWLVAMPGQPPARLRAADRGEAVKRYLDLVGIIVHLTAPEMLRAVSAVEVPP
jgi:hypothetical protein